MTSINSSMQCSSADISTVNTTYSDTHSDALEPDVNENTLEEQTEDLNARLSNFEVAFATMEAKLNFLAAQKNAPAPAADNYIGSDPEMSWHIRLAFTNMKFAWNFDASYHDDSNRSVRDELILHVMAIPAHYNSPLSVIKKRVYNHYRNSRVAALNPVVSGKNDKLSVRSRERSRKTTKLASRKKAYWKNLYEFSDYPGADMFLTREYQSEEEEDEEDDCFVRRSFTYRRGGLVRFFDLVDSFRTRSRSNPSSKRKIVPLQCELSPKQLATFPPWALKD